jgi:ubiquinone/menaquinone biosynthesis C-methylase UbiE
MSRTCPTVSPAMNCDALAPYYRALEYASFGKALEARRFAFLPQLTSARSAILGGDGDGRFVEALLRTNSRVRIDFVDISARMIRMARLRVHRMGEDCAGRVRFFAEDIRQFTPPSAAYDLVATHFFLDCFSQQEIGGVVQSMAKWMAPNAKWVLSDFSERSRGLSRVWTCGVVRTLYAAFRLTTHSRVTRLPDIDRALTAANLVEEARQTALGGLLFSAIWSRKSASVERACATHQANSCFGN